MDYKEKNDLIASLIKKGYIIDDNTTKNLLLSFDDYLQGVADDEVKLLEEISIIEQKISKKEKLSYLETTFWNYFLKQYSCS